MILAPKGKVPSCYDNGIGPLLEGAVGAHLCFGITRTGHPGDPCPTQESWHYSSGEVLPEVLLWQTAFQVPFATPASDMVCLRGVRLCASILGSS